MKDLQSKAKEAAIGLKTKLLQNEKIAPIVRRLNNRETLIYGGIGALLVFIYFYIFFGLPSPYSLKDYKVVPLATHILDRNGKLLYEIFREEKRTPVKISSLPPYVWKATVSTEDKEFFRHRGVSITGGIIRAVKETLLRRQLQGGSTITQQLVKSALLTPERTIRRKIKEIVLALWTEKIYTKDQILELYLNQVPYGGSSYGIEEAARTYFNKPANKLSLSQAALLAGLPQAPSLYSPQINPDLSKLRRNEVLQAMLEQKYITKGAYQKALKEPIVVSKLKTEIKAPHFVFYIKSLLDQQYGIRAVEEGGLRVITTLDLSLQEQSEKILREELDKVKNLRVSNGAALVTRPPTGEILAMVGSADYFATPSGAFNVTTAFRQPGSSIKPLNYAVGLERHLVTASTTFLDAQTCFPSFPRKYCPVNYDGRFHGPVQLRFALGNSYNIPAVKMLALNGVREFIASTSAFTMTTFKDPSNYGLSLTLGGGEVRMTEFAQAFSVFANRGVPRELNGILKVADNSGKVLFQFRDPNFTQNTQRPIPYPNSLAIPGKKAISQETAFIISHILLDNNARSSAFGSSSFLVVPGKTVSVKTGTTDDKKDNWTIGYTPNFLTVVWVGNNDNTPMDPYLTSGVTGAAPIWNRVITYILKNQPNQFPIKPSTVVGRQVCTTGGQVAAKKEDGSSDCPTRFEYFIAGTENLTLAQFKTEKKKVFVTKDSDKMITDMTGVDPSKIEEKEKTVVDDGFSTYCLDCIGDQPQPSPTPTP